VGFSASDRIAHVSRKKLRGPIWLRDQVDFTNVQLAADSPVPEPATWGLAILAGAALLIYRSSLSGWAKSVKALAGILTVRHLALRGLRCVR